MPITRESILSVIKYIETMLEAIASAGPEGLPSGHLYAMVMGNLTIEQYQQVIGLLKEAGRVREAGHMLYAVRRA